MHRSTPSAHASPPVRPRRPAEARARKVVYLEDDSANVALMQNVLDDLGHITLITAHTADIGLALVRAHQPDVVMLDLDVPSMNGVALAEALRASPDTRAIPVVALTSAALLREHGSAQLAMFDRCLTTPLALDELTETLASLFAR